MADYSSADYRWPASGEPVFVGATLPTLKVTPMDKNGPIDFSDPGNTITFSAWDLSTGVVKTNGASATFDATANQLVYTWTAADVDTASDYRCYFTITSANGVQNIPRGKYITIRRITAGG